MVNYVHYNLKGSRKRHRREFTQRRYHLLCRRVKMAHNFHHGVGDGDDDVCDGQPFHLGADSDLPPNHGAVEGTSISRVGDRE